MERDSSDQSDPLEQVAAANLCADRPKENDMAILRNKFCKLFM